MSKEAMLRLAVPLIQEFEGLELAAYPDPLSGGEPWTIGYGSTRWEDGSRVRRGQTITKEGALALLGHQLEHYILPPLAKIPCWPRLSPARQAALTSFAWNLGPNFYGSEGFETISRCLREEDFGAVGAAFLLYVNPGSNVEVGLRRRREAERALWNQG
jgi:lysozyme